MSSLVLRLLALLPLRVLAPGRSDRRTLRPATARLQPLDLALEGRRRAGRRLLPPQPAPEPLAVHVSYLVSGGGTSGGRSRSNVMGAQSGRVERLSHCITQAKTGGPR